MMPIPELLSRYYPHIVVSLSFFVKALLLLGVLALERVVGYPIMSSYIFLGLVERNSLWQQFVLILIFCITLSSLYGVNILIIFALLGAGKTLLSLGLFRKQKLLRIIVATLVIVGGFGFAGVRFTVMSGLYGLIQVSLLAVLQLRRGWYRRATW